MKLYQIKTILIFTLLTVSAYGSGKCGTNPRTLSCLYSQINSLESSGKIENSNLILKNYNLVVSSATWCASCQRGQVLAEDLANKFQKELNVIVVFDNYHQDMVRIQNLAPRTKSYEHFDKNRELYYFFHDVAPIAKSTQEAVAKAVLIGPTDEVLYMGPLVYEADVEKIQSKIKRSLP